ncbi:small G protein signaling modulator 2-like isoform X2 [Artemia franciscana]
MEEAVTRKYIHTNSSSITSFSAAVEACLSHELRRRTLGLFRSSCTTALLLKAAKFNADAKHVADILGDLESADGGKRSSSSGDSTTKLSFGAKPALQKRNSASLLSNSTTVHQRYVWIKIALFERKLTDIVDYLVQNSNKYYEKESVLADPDYGPVLSSLMVGPCALDFSRMKTQDHFWSDPPAEELVQRHQMSTSAYTNGNSFNTPVSKTLGLQGKSNSNPSITAQDYVASLHQNSKSTLLYGKNNVGVLPVGGSEVLQGYLSLHDDCQILLLKWTPNQIMSAVPDSNDNHEKRNFWDFALAIAISEIVYLHCHQTGEKGGVMIPVGQDGSQFPPITFPAGGHLLAFLTCLEAGLPPNGYLDPPLDEDGTGKIFPRLRRRSSEKDEQSGDYVFRIVCNSPMPARETPSPPRSLSKESRQRRSLKRSDDISSHGTSSSKSSLSYTDSLQEVFEAGKDTISSHLLSNGDSLSVLCSSMRRQIISRAFEGWYSCTKHLKDIKMQLFPLLNRDFDLSIVRIDESPGLTKEVFNQLYIDGVLQDYEEVLRLTYLGGVDPELRKVVWPYLLGHYQFGSTVQERQEKDSSLKQIYESTMSEWLAVEAITRQRDRDQTAANIAKLSSGSYSLDCQEVIDKLTDFEPNCERHKLTKLSRGLSNDVFQDHNYHNNERDLTDVTEVLSGTDEFFTPETDRKASSAFAEDLKSETAQESSSSAIPIHLERKASERNIHKFESRDEDDTHDKLTVDEIQDVFSIESRSSCISPASSSHGGVYSLELLEQFGLNIHRIDKDVQRCDRNYWYFSTANLDKLRNIMCTYVWEHLEVGYMQGMCDLLAPLLVVLDDEALTYSCFCKVMERLSSNFPHGGMMDKHFSNMKMLIQILEPELYDVILGSENPQLYFCYRWFLLDFKREFKYEDIFLIWEVLWAAPAVTTENFHLFGALALLQLYKHIIIAQNMDYTDLIKFFNEMAEKHNAVQVLMKSRQVVQSIQKVVMEK